MRGALKARPLVRRRPLPRTADLVLPPPLAGGPQAAAVLVPGMGVDSAAYRPMLSAMQQAAAEKGLSLFAGCVHYDWSAPTLRHPSDLGPHLDAVVAALVGRGLKPGMPVFHAAHSISTVLLQDYLAGGRPTAGQILLGGCLLRKHCHPVFSYRVPTLTVGAELDGEESLARQAEQHCVQRNMDPKQFPFVVLEGQTHMQFASGPRPPHMRQELPPAVGDGAAHRAIGGVAVDFMRLRLGLRGAGHLVRERVRQTAGVLPPPFLPTEAASHWLDTAVGPSGMVPGSLHANLGGAASAS